MEQGKIPPQAVELEEAVLGALMIDKNALNEVIDILESECFYKDDQTSFTHFSIRRRNRPSYFLQIRTETEKSPYTQAIMLHIVS